ncbi:MAG: SpoIID/LytB domain-containing protein, partial [Fusobacteriaceae bacterium]
MICCNKKIIVSSVLAFTFTACSLVETSKNNVIRERIKNEKNALLVRESEIKEDKKIDLSQFGDIPKSRKGVDFPYLKTVSHLITKKDYSLDKDEVKALDFYKRTDIKAYGDNASFYRWNFDRSETELLKILEKNIVKVQSAHSRNVLQFKNGKWEKSGKLTKNPIGKLEYMLVTERDNSGMALALLIKGDKGTYLIHKKYNLRKIFGGGEYKVYSSMNKRRLLTNPTLIPSGFFAFEKKDGRYYFYGGGYGHGVGLSQAGAQDLTKNYGKKYGEVIKFYYPGTDVSKFENTTIRVAITNTEKKLDHKIVTLNTISGMKIKFLEKTYNIAGHKTLSIKNTGTSIEIKSDGEIIAKGRGDIRVSSEKSTLKLTSIKRSYKKNNSPSYHGELSIKASGKDSLRIVNYVLLERYLENVVPSEMSPDYGVEPLKVQAIAARTYAVRFHE